ncbi:hypothetical protein MRX96_002442 [Rhipicephalus microplus]
MAAAGPAKINNSAGSYRFQAGVTFPKGSFRRGDRCGGPFVRHTGRDPGTAEVAFSSGTPPPLFFESA